MKTIKQQALFCLAALVVFAMSSHAQTPQPSSIEVLGMSRDEVRQVAKQVENLSNYSGINLPITDFLIEGDQMALDSATLALKERVKNAAHQVAKMLIIAARLKTLVNMTGDASGVDPLSGSVSLYQTNQKRFQEAFNLLIANLTDLQIKDEKYGFTASVKSCQSSACVVTLLAAFGTLQTAGIALNQDFDVSDLGKFVVRLESNPTFISRTISEVMNELKPPNKNNPGYETILAAGLSPFIALASKGVDLGARFVQLFTNLKTANLKLIAYRTASHDWVTHLNTSFGRLQDQELYRVMRIETADEMFFDTSSITTNVGSNLNSDQTFYQTSFGKRLVFKIGRHKMLMIPTKTMIDIWHYKSSNGDVFLSFTQDTKDPTHFAGRARRATYDLYIDDRGSHFLITLKQNGKTILKDGFIDTQNLLD
jgi:hypothetical protein